MPSPSTNLCRSSSNEIWPMLNNTVCPNGAIGPDTCQRNPRPQGCVKLRHALIWDKIETKLFQFGTKVTGVPGASPPKLQWQ